MFERNEKLDAQVEALIRRMPRAKTPVHAAILACMQDPAAGRELLAYLFRLHDHGDHAWCGRRSTCGEQGASK